MKSYELLAKQKNGESGTTMETLELQKLPKVQRKHLTLLMQHYLVIYIKDQH